MFKLAVPKVYNNISFSSVRNADGKCIQGFGQKKKTEGKWPLGRPWCR
jgi:hypothetical protein